MPYVRPVKTGSDGLSWPRPIPKPEIPPGQLAELKDLLYRLYTEAGMPAADMIAVVAADDELPGAPSQVFRPSGTRMVAQAADPQAWVVHADAARSRSRTPIICSPTPAGSRRCSPISTTPRRVLNHPASHAFSQLSATGWHR